MVGRSAFRFDSVAAWIHDAFLELVYTLRIPLIVGLSVASGFTTFGGLSLYITDWVALIVACAVQCTVVVSAVELSRIAMRVNVIRYAGVASTLIVATAVSVYFSYFKFYEFSEREALQQQRIIEVSQALNNYATAVETWTATVVAEPARDALVIAERTLQEIAMGRGMAPPYDKVGQGPAYHAYSPTVTRLRRERNEAGAHTATITRSLSRLRLSMNAISDRAATGGDSRSQVLSALREVQDAVGQVSSAGYRNAPSAGTIPPIATAVSTAARASDVVRAPLSWLALALAAIVDFLAIALSYRIHDRPPRPLSEEEGALAYQGLTEFHNWTLTNRGELETRVGLNEWERRQGYNDGFRGFITAWLREVGAIKQTARDRIALAPPVIAAAVKELLKRNGRGRGPTAGDGEGHADSH